MDCNKNYKTILVIETIITYFSGHHRDVVPFGHFSVQGFQCCDGAIHRINVEQPF